MTKCDCSDLDRQLFKCADCGMCTNCAYEYYMVHNEVWYSVVTAMDKSRMLCIGCLEQRLGRLLTKDDFTDAPVNTIWGFYGSTRLQDRLRSAAKPAIV